MPTQPIPEPDPRKVEEFTSFQLFEPGSVPLPPGTPAVPRPERDELVQRVLNDLHAADQHPLQEFEAGDDGGSSLDSRKL
jgi:hypothetical protein